jgi:hypothetical protein
MTGVSLSRRNLLLPPSASSELGTARKLIVRLVPDELGARMRERYAHAHCVGATVPNLDRNPSHITTPGAMVPSRLSPFLPRDASIIHSTAARTSILSELPIWIRFARRMRELLGSRYWGLCSSKGPLKTRRGPTTAPTVCPVPCRVDCDIELISTQTWRGYSVYSGSTPLC